MKLVLKTNIVALSISWSIPIFLSTCNNNEHCWATCDNSQFSRSRCFSSDWFNSL